MPRHRPAEPAPSRPPGPGHRRFGGAGASPSDAPARQSSSPAPVSIPPEHSGHRAPDGCGHRQDLVAVWDIGPLPPVGRAEVLLLRDLLAHAMDELSQQDQNPL